MGGYRLVIGDKALRLFANPACNFLLYTVEVAAEIRLLHVGFVNVLHNELKVFVEPAFHGGFVDQQQVRLHEEVIALISRGYRFGESFMPVI